MITYADVEKLLATRSEDPPVLSLYLEVPLDLPALRGLPARAGELVNSAAGGPCGPGGPHAGRALTEARQAVRRILEDSARDWLGHCVAIFICGPARAWLRRSRCPPGLASRPCSGPGRMSGRCWWPCTGSPPTASSWLTAVTPGCSPWREPDRHGGPARGGGRAQPALRRLVRPGIAPGQRAHRRTHAPSLPRHTASSLRPSAPARSGSSSAATPTPSRSSSPPSRLTCVTASLAASSRTPPP